MNKADLLIVLIFGSITLLCLLSFMALQCMTSQFICKTTQFLCSYIINFKKRFTMVNIEPITETMIREAEPVIREEETDVCSV